MALKQCLICKNFLEEEENFYKIINKQNGNIKYHSYCKECTKKKSRRWALDNPEKAAKSKMKNQKTDKWKILHREHEQKVRGEGIYRKYQQSNPGKMKQYRNNRKHKIHDITTVEWENCKKYFNYQCAYCALSLDEHKEMYSQDLHKDHVIYNGSNKIDNCVPACKSCNSLKWQYDIDEWYKKQDFYKSENLEKIYCWIKKDYVKENR